MVHGVPATTGRHYLYAIVAGDIPRAYPSLGLDGKDVYTITDGRVAAVVSRLSNNKARPERANLKAHQAVLNRLLADTTPLPMAFGTIANSPQAILKILVKNRRAFDEQAHSRGRQGRDGIACQPGTCPISLSTSSTFTQSCVRRGTA